MKILVCISHVPDTTSKINFSKSDTAFDKTGVQFIINPLDEYALTRAIWIKEKQGATVTVINVGDSSTEPTLRKALAIGADQAIRVNGTPLDGFYTAKQLSEVVKNGDFDLILTGRESIDYNGGMVPGMLASLLNFDFVNGCIGLELKKDKIIAKREIDGGSETLELSLPAVIAGQKDLVLEKELIIPNMRGIMMARKKPLKVVEAVDFSPKTQTKKFEKPAPKGNVKLVDAGSIEELVDLLHKEAKVI